MSCLYILEIKPVLVTLFANIFSHSVGCLFVLFMVSFALQNLTSLIRSHLFIFAFISIALVRKHWYNFCQRMFYLCSMVSCLMFKSLSHSEFIFVHGVRMCSNFTDLHAAVQLSQHPLLKRLFFPTVCSCFLYWRLIDCRCVGLFLGSTLFQCQYHTVFTSSHRSLILLSFFFFIWLPVCCSD